MPPPSPARRKQARKIATMALKKALIDLNSVILASRDVGVKCAVLLIDYPDAHGLASLVIQETEDSEPYTIGPRPRREPIDEEG